MPLSIPPRMTTGAPNDHIAALPVCHTWPQENFWRIPKPWRQEAHTATVMKESPMRRPTSMPPANNCEVEMLVMKPKMTIGIEGGMMMPIEPPAATTAAAKAGGYQIGR